MHNPIFIKTTPGNPLKEGRNRRRLKHCNPRIHALRLHHAIKVIHPNIFRKYANKGPIRTIRPDKALHYRLFNELFGFRETGDRNLRKEFSRVCQCLRCPLPDQAASIDENEPVKNH